MNKNWTAKEDKLVTSKYSKLGAIELAKIMGRILRFMQRIY